MNFQELWHQAYALGAQIVFWPSMMATPDRDAISASRLFRYHVVANGWKTYGGPADPALPGVPGRPFYSPGTMLDSTGEVVEDFQLIGKVGCPCCKPCPSSKLNTTASIGTLDLDATWVHVSRTIIAGIWVAFFQECQQQSCGQGSGRTTGWQPSLTACALRERKA